MKLKRIQKLDPHLVNHIAAGEVVERPAAVVKETLENSLDAKATQIHIIIEKGGTSLISIEDNGTGIHKDDLALAVHRHATSKINSLQDLSAISSLGFRGEALASIAAVSRFNLISRTADADTAWQLKVDGGVMHTIAPAANPIGTRIEIAELFFNTPARRRFLRSEKTEYLRIIDVIQRFVLSAFTTAISFTHNGKKIYQFPVAKQEKEKMSRVKAILGDAFIRQAYHIEYRATHMQLTGWIGNQDYYLHHSNAQYFYINGRIIRDRTIMHAIKLAFSAVIPADQFAAYILFLEIDPQAIDVNVHPTKHEVRFQDRRLVHDFITSSILNSLQQQKPFVPRVNHSSQHENTPESTLHIGKKQKHRTAVSVNKTNKPQTIEVLAALQQIYQSDNHHLNAKQSLSETRMATDTLTMQNEQAASQTAKTDLFGEPICLMPPYLLLCMKHELNIAKLIICDLQQIKKHNLQQMFATKVKSQPLLAPKVISLTQSPDDLFDKKLHWLRSINCDIDRFGDKRLIVRALPGYWRGIEVESFLRTWLMDKSINPNLNASNNEDWIGYIANLAVKFWQPPQQLHECNQLLQEFYTIWPSDLIHPEMNATLKLFCELRAADLQALINSYPISLNKSPLCT